MSTAYVPQQPQQPQHAAPPPAPPATPPHASEATRLLCAGTYLDSGYRDRVIEELHLNSQRFVAPSLGFDAARVLAHALRARRQELAWSAAILGLWVVGAALTDGLLIAFLGPSLYLAIGSWIKGRNPAPPVYRRVTAFLFRWWGCLMFAALLAINVVAAFGGGGDSSPSDPYGDGYDSYDGLSGDGSGPLNLIDILLFVLGFKGLSGTIKPWQAWAALVVFAAIVLCTAGQRGAFARVLAAELSPQRFPDAAGDPAEQGESRRFQWLKHRIRTEQHAPLAMYHELRPFCGAGAAYPDWVLAVELKPDPLKKQQPISNRLVLEKIRPLVERLRLPAEYAGPGVRDRLRWLEIDECVFLPAEGLLRREEAPYHPQAFEEHRAHAVEEGAEKRRHFLRIRVGGWEEELVVTVFVRIHTQGRMLMLEIAPHVLLPVRADFKDADRAAHRFRHNNVLGKAVWAMARMPGSLVRSLAVLGKSVAYGCRLLTGGYTNALPDGPALSVRELGSVEAGSHFQEMDVSRYLKSIQDRVANGVRAALAESGYQTGEFVQQINNISNGGVHIGKVEGSTFAVGDQASASSTTGGGAPQKGADAHDNG
ncbi:hypothetical protein [Streptomyces sp. NK08204]|uniref:hypothetical protein n=1 Tax=Streptomyces sp. NK08204 TaxID=2873260 RepID=UPI001CECE6A3|nr:hypothetical protein [Streptomyces sp. NK08204]